MCEGVRQATTAILTSSVVHAVRVSAILKVQVAVSVTQTRASAAACLVSQGGRVTSVDHDMLSSTASADVRRC